MKKPPLLMTLLTALLLPALAPLHAETTPSASIRFTPPTRAAGDVMPFYHAGEKPLSVSSQPSAVAGNFPAKSAAWAKQINKTKLPDEVRARQVKDLKFGMFICWSFSTFYGQEWTPTTGKDASYFKATGCDTDQWCKTAKEAGMNYILFLHKDYQEGVKHGNVFALNVGPDYAGRLRDIDVRTLREIGEMIRTKAPVK